MFPVGQPPTLSALALSAVEDALSPNPPAAPGLDPSLEPRIDPPRLPQDLLVHLCALVERFRVAFPGKASLHKVLTDCGRDFLQHPAWMPQVRCRIEAGLAAIRAIHEASPEDRARAEAIGQALLEALPGRHTPFPRTRLHDNPHGRAFDSLTANALVTSPPDEVARLVERMCAAYRTDCDADPRTGAALRDLCEAWSSAPRAWMGDAPHFAMLVETAREDERVARHRLGRYLDRPLVAADPADPAKRGLDLIARIYLLMALSVGRQREDLASDSSAAGRDSLHFMRRSTERVGRLLDPARTRESREGDLHLSDGIGITLAHQPVVASPHRLRAERPATVCRPGVPAPGGGRRYSPLIDEQHVRGLPFATGVSGCTSVLLHLFADQRDRGLLDKASSAGDALLAAAMTLTYDGGHSLFEAFWTGQRLNAVLTLGLGLDGSDGAVPGDAGDYERVLRALRPETARAFRRAMTEGWKGTIDYFDRHHPRARELPAPRPMPTSTSTSTSMTPGQASRRSVRPIRPIRQ